MATLRSMMAADAVSGGAFLPNDSDGNPDGFNQTVYFYPRGNLGAKATVNAIVDQGHLEGTREALGDGVVLDRHEGRSVRESLVLEIPAAVGVATNQHHTDVDLFKIGGEMYAVKRIVGRDDYMQAVLVVKRKDLETRQFNRNG